MTDGAMSHELHLSEQLARQRVNPSMHDAAKAVPRRRVWYAVVLAVLVLLAADLVYAMLTNPRFEWHVVGRYFFSWPVLRGVLTTIYLTAIVMVVGILVGGLVALARLSRNKVFSTLAAAYTWLFRAVPLLVQLIFWYNLAYFTPTIGLGIPFIHTFGEWDTNVVLTPLLAAVLGLGLHDGAYMSEIIRSGIMSVDDGQRDAARAVGMRRSTAFFWVVLPQALRIMIPPTSSQIIQITKSTSLVSVIGVTELLYSVQNVYQRTLEVVPLLIVASLWYIIIIGVLSIFQSRIEARLSRSFRPVTAHE